MQMLSGAEKCLTVMYNINLIMNIIRDLTTTINYNQLLRNSYCCRYEPVVGRGECDGYK